MMIFYPLTLFISDFPIIVVRILQIAQIHFEILTEISYYLVSLAGFFNSIVYGFFSTLHNREY